MKQAISWPHFGALVLLGSISYGAAAYFPIEGLARELSLVPGVAALVGLVIQILRDHNEFQKQRQLQTEMKDYELAAASHMANTVFDKHVAFCEEYIAEGIACLKELSTRGPAAPAIELARNLAAVRSRHAAWITPEIESQLLAVEEGLISVGANEFLLGSLPVGHQRTKVVGEMIEQFKILTRRAPIDGAQRSTNQGDAGEQMNTAIVDAIQHLRVILGVDDLTKMRQRIVAAAGNRSKI